MKFEFKLDGKLISVDEAPTTRLLTVLKENLGIKSVHGNCHGGECGLCTVLLDGSPVASCLVPLFSVKGREVVTFEGFSRQKEYRAIKEALERNNCTPCPFCYPSKVLAISYLIETETTIEEAEVLELYNDYRCYCHNFTSLYNGVKDAALSHARS